MKKTVIILAIIIGILSVNKTETIIIPKEAIRFRVIANSNKESDQIIKKKVVNNLKKNIKKIQTTSLTETRNNINKSLPDFKSVVEETLKNEHINYTIDYGMNYFPEKEYKGIYYEEGEYESLVITLGEGIGDNFWCLLFPPLCLIDEEETTDVEYTSLIKELINKYF